MKKGPYKHWRREDGLTGRTVENEIASYTRKWDETFLYIEKLGAGDYKAVAMITPYAERGSDEVLVASGSEQHVKDEAQEWMIENGDKVFTDDRERDNTIWEFYMDRFDYFGSRRKNAEAADFLSTHYHVDVELDTRDGVEIQNGTVKSTQHNEEVVLTIPHQRGAVHSTSVRVDIERIIEQILDDRDLYNDETYRQVVREIVYGDGHLPKIENELALEVGKAGAENLIDKWESETIRFHKKSN